MLNKVLRTISDYIARYALLDKNKKYLVAVSGGADSVALLMILHQLGYLVEAVHCNFHLRGEESYRDEQFVVDFCSRKDIVLHRVHFDTREYAELHKQSIELAARNLRYRYFEQLRRDIGASAICVAHHRDDLAETVIMNLVRGTGIHGLVGIRPRYGNIVRPLLCISREDVEMYLAAIGQDYVTDSTNLEDEATRNLFRHHVMPMLKDINPKAVENIAHTACLMLDAEMIFDSEIERLRKEMKDGDKISIRQLLAHHAPSTVLYELLSPYGFTGVNVLQIMESVKAGNTGRLFYSDTHIVAVGPADIEIGCRDIANFKPMQIPFDGNYVLSDGMKITVDTMDVSICEISRNASIATLDADEVSFPLTVRRVQTADRFRPFGMKGSKLVSDFMADAKCSYFERREQLVVVDADNNIIWLVGRRTSEICRISVSTKKVVRLGIISG